MSLFGVMGTSISGMAAQASRLGTVGDNIANSGTTGYKRADSQFETLLGNNSGGGVGSGTYDPGGVNTIVRYTTTEQGQVQGTSSVTNLAIQGNGFFLVNSSAGTAALTRAGAFVPDSSGNLINAAGYYLMGYDLKTNPTAANGIDGLSKVNIVQAPLQAIPSTSGVLTANLPSTAAIVPAASLPSTNDPAATYTEKTSIVAYDNLGAPVNLDVYLSKSSATDWEVTVYNKADAASGGGFPYAAGPLDTQTLTFDPTTGKLASSSTTSLSVAIPNGATVPIDMSSMTQLAADYSVTAASTNGSAPSSVDHIEISNAGILTSVYANGVRIDNFKIPLATVASTANLTAESGNVYEPNGASGPILLGSANAAGYGSIASSALESSNVDLATELSNMIVAQRSYEANSKVLQTGAELLHVLTQLNT